MKKLLFTVIGALCTMVACSDREHSADNDSRYDLLTAFAVQVGSSYYHADIDQFDRTVSIGGIDDLSSITGVVYTLANPNADVWPTPESLIGKWRKSQTIVITDSGRQTAYDIIFTYYDEEQPGKNPKPENPEDPDENVIFFDDFDGTGHPNDEYWKLCTKDNSAWNQHFIDSRDWANETLEVLDGVTVLVLTAQKADGEYSNAGIRSKFGVGLNTRLEVRARLETATGGFPAIWQMPVNGKTWPISGEIDIMEWVKADHPTEIWHTIHTSSSATSGIDKSSSNRSPVPDNNTYCVYAVERTADAVVFFVDGKEVGRYDNLYLDDDGLQYPFDLYEYDIILNYSFGGPLNGNMTWPGAITDSEFPAHMYIDWVKVVKLDAE